MATRTAKPAEETPPADAEEKAPISLEDVRNVIGEALGSLFDSGKADVVDTAEKADDVAPEEKPATIRQVEEIAARMMRSAQDGIKKKAPEKAETKAPAPAETPPQPQRTWREKLWS
jgi:hypothetical protein